MCGWRKSQKVVRTVKETNREAKHETIAPLNSLYQCTTHEGRDLHFVVRCIDDRAGALQHSTPPADAVQ